MAAGVCDAFAGCLEGVVTSICESSSRLSFLSAPAPVLAGELSCAFERGAIAASSRDRATRVPAGIPGEAKYARDTVLASLPAQNLSVCVLFIPRPRNRQFSRLRCAELAPTD